MALIASGGLRQSSRIFFSGSYHIRRRNVDRILQRHYVLIEFLVLRCFRLAGQRRCRQMVHSQKIVIRRTDVSLVRIPLEQQILHVDRDAQRDLMHNLRIGRRRYIDANPDQHQQSHAA